MEKKIYGTITDISKEKVFIPSVYVGNGSTEINGKEVEFEFSTTWKQTPIVKLGNKYFCLSWEDILQIAKDRGLFEVVK